MKEKKINIFFGIFQWLKERKKKKRKKKMVHNLKWATAQLSRRLGAGLGARHSDTARRHAGEARGTQARRRQHGRASAGRAGSGALGAGALGAQGERGRGARAAG